MLDEAITSGPWCLTNAIYISQENLPDMDFGELLHLRSTDTVPRLRSIVLDRLGLSPLARGRRLWEETVRRGSVPPWFNSTGLSVFEPAANPGAPLSSAIRWDVTATAAPRKVFSPESLNTRNGDVNSVVPVPQLRWPPRLLYDRRTTKRKLVAASEDRLLEVFRNAGVLVDVVELGLLSPEDQIQRVAGSDMLLAVAGAGLTNCAWLRPRALCIELSTSNLPGELWHRFISAMGVQDMSWRSLAPGNYQQDINFEREKEVPVWDSIYTLDERLIIFTDNVMFQYLLSNPDIVVDLGASISSRGRDRS